MYRLMFYFLMILVVVSVIYSLFGVLPYKPQGIIFSSLFLIAVCLITNKLFAKLYNVPANIESPYITSLILTLIITPVQEAHGFLFLFIVGLISMASKYIFSLKNKHLFNPAAFAVVIAWFAFGIPASWWVGNLPMFPFVFFGGLLIIRKLQKEAMVYVFFITTAIVFAILGTVRGVSISGILNIYIYTSVLFFATVMFTEPLTTPPTRKLQIVYGILVGILYSSEFHAGNIYLTPETALIIGNIFSYIVSPKEKLVLKLKEKIKTSIDTYDFIFPFKPKFSYIPGQYMEWTLGHKNVDPRGNRRYFTLASSPTEDHLRIGVKFYEHGSTLKKALLNADLGTRVIAGQRAGDFILSENKEVKYIFLGGGIGITPFRSILKYLIDKQEKRDIVLFYSNKKADEIVYRDVFDLAERKLGIKTVYTTTDRNSIPKGWNGEKGRIDGEMIRRKVPDYFERTYYLSGPHGMVSSFEEVLGNLGIKKEKIKTDFFPGYA
ncbi:MAG: Oxidoreductase FAD/NAD(P)-binding domain protein [Candidatus Gottesmanbacteria bacterium GW2011_GWC2_39_8]|uniref:Oxidoreductase FAD/NAD(P)-binding domain protein n=1 Tax=Candidatus Gottesmanbacteria bacterium GW2011_GWC2_39_8 TaxID=1618450 RepID=A0A0G0PXH5_9BACT|nr:MAG: Oxidoreductase FAD/NAD(P)-binding domain protein [Candidatus Gottesmanbacteria bacterium GW2011_GWC2_39_8]